MGFGRFIRKPLNPVDPGSKVSWSEAAILDFLSGVTSTLGAVGTIRDLGAAKESAFHFQGRDLRLTCNGSSYSVAGDLHWSDYPENSVVKHAPDWSYQRSAILSEGTPVTTTGDAAFDNEYLLIGYSLDQAERFITARVRGALMAFSDLNPGIHSYELQFDPPQVLSRLHVEINPGLSDDPETPLFAKIGSERFTAASCTDSVRRFCQLLELLDPS